MATTDTLRNFIDGDSVASQGESEQILNPATGEQMALAPRSTPEEVDSAVMAARRALSPWSASSPSMGQTPRSGFARAARPSRAALP